MSAGLGCSLAASGVAAKERGRALSAKERLQMTTVYVVAWAYASGGGFDWYRTQDAADKAYEAEVLNVAELARDSWTAYRFDVETAFTAPRSITREIDQNLYELCANAAIHNGPLGQVDHRDTPPDSAKPYRLINIENDEATDFETQEEARGAASFDRLRRFEIWKDGKIVGCWNRDRDSSNSAN